MPPKKSPTARAGAGDDVDGTDGGLTFEQRMMLLQVKMEFELKVKQTEAGNLRLQMDLADRQA